MAQNELFRPPRHGSMERIDSDFRDIVLGSYASLLAPICAVPEKTKVLNIGCGDSLWLEENLAMRFPSTTFISMDINIVALLKARFLHEAHPLIATDAKAFAFPPDTFEAIILNGSVGEFGTKEEIIDVLIRLTGLLKRQGKLLIHTLSSEHQPLYNKYQTGTDWILAGLRGTNLFSSLDFFRTSEKHLSDMVVVVKV